MHKYNTLFFSALLFLIACGPKTPPGIIEKKKMVNLLTELHIIDGSLYMVSLTPDSMYRHGIGRYNALFKRYHTDSAQFNKSFRYYSSNPLLFKGMYTQIVRNIQHLSDSLNHNTHPVNALPEE